MKNKMIDKFMGIDLGSVSTNYDRSWDHLMPVLERIKDYVYGPGGKPVDVRYFEQIVEARIIETDAFWKNDMGTVYAAIVDFIKFLNIKIVRRNKNNAEKIL